MKVTRQNMNLIWNQSHMDVLHDARLLQLGKWDNLWYSHLEETSSAALSFGMNFCLKEYCKWNFGFLNSILPQRTAKQLFLNKENAIFFKLLILFQIVIAKVCNFHTKKARFDSPRRNSPRNKRLGELPEKVLKRCSKIPFCGRGLNSLLPLTS